MSDDALDVALEDAEDMAMMQAMSVEPEDDVKPNKIMEPEDAAYMAASFLPGAGIAESPMIMKSLKQGDMIDAFLYSLGVVGDATYVAGPMVGATVGTALKGAKRAGLLARKSKSVDELAAIEKKVDEAAELTPAEKMYGDDEIAEYWSSGSDDVASKSPDFDPTVDGYSPPGFSGKDTEEVVDRIAEGYLQPQPTGFKHMAETERALSEGKASTTVNPARSAEQKIYKGDDLRSVVEEKQQDLRNRYLQGKFSPYEESLEIRGKFNEDSPYMYLPPSNSTHAELRRSFVSTSEDPLVSLFSFATRNGENELGLFKDALKERMFVLERYDGEPIANIHIENISPEMYRFLSKAGEGGVIKKATQAQKKRIRALLEAKHGDDVELVDNLMKQLDQYPDDADLFHADIVMNDLGIKIPKHGIGHVEDEIAFANPEKMRFRELTAQEQKDLAAAAKQSQDNFKTLALLPKVLEKHGADAAYDAMKKALRSQMGLARIANVRHTRASFDRIIRDELRMQRKTIEKIRNELGTNQRADALTRILDDIDTSKAYRSKRAEDAGQYPKRVKEGEAGAIRKQMKKLKKSSKKMNNPEHGRLYDAQYNVLKKKLRDPQTSHGIHKDIDTMNEGGLVK